MPGDLAEADEPHLDDMADPPAIPEDLTDLEAHIPPPRVPVERLSAKGHHYAPRPPHQTEEDWCAMSSNDRNKMLRAYDCGVSVPFARLENRGQHLIHPPHLLVFRRIARTLLVRMRLRWCCIRLRGRCT